jgi:hypothetical protein
MINEQSEKDIVNFRTIPFEQSVGIYREFVNGRVVTKLVYDPISGEMEESAAFSLLFNKRFEFELLYKLIGFSLEFHEKGDFFFVKADGTNSGEEDISDANAVKIQACLLMLGRYYATVNISIDQIGMFQFGINESDLDKLRSNVEYNSILKSAGFKSWDDALRFITERNFAFKSGKSTYFLSSAGMHYLNNLVGEYSNS